MASALSVRQVSKTFATPEGGTVHALAEVSLEVEDGSFTVLLGPSGCGKTTLLRCVAGLESPDTGQILLRGERIDDVPVWRRRVNTVFQSYALFPHMNVAQNVAFGLQMDRLPKEEIANRTTAALAMVRLEDLAKRRPSQLSGGQQQRVALARALAKRPEVLLLDEPLSALDLKLRRGMQEELKRLQRETSITFVLVTHDQEEAMAMGDQVAVFDAGRIAQVGAPQDVYSNPRTRFVADFLGEANLLVGEVTPQGIAVAGFGLIPGAWITGAAPGAGSCTLAVRPEHVTLSGPGNPNGRISDITFVGGDLHVRVHVSGTVLSARVPSDSNLTVGDQVAVSFRAAKVVDD